jgi:hypothetical protein
MAMRAILREPRKIVPLLIAALFFLTLYFNNSPYVAKVVFYPVYRELKKQSFIFDCRKYSVLDSENFRIFYENIGYNTLEMIKDGVEENLKNVFDDFGFQLKSKINIIVYSEYNVMAVKIGLNGSSTAMGVYYGGIISILDPVKWIQNDQKISEIFTRDGPMVHELTHLVIDYMASGNIPVWFTEGAALYEEYRLNNVMWAEGKVYKEYYDIRELERNFYNLDEIKAYKQSLLVIKYIGDNFGMEGITYIIRQLRTGKSIDQAVYSVLHMSKQELFERSLSQETGEALVFGSI